MKAKKFSSIGDAIAYAIKRLDGTVVTFDDEDDNNNNNEQSGDVTNVNCDTTPYTFIMGEAPKHFNGQEFAKLLLAKCPEVANYNLEDYGGSDSYLSMDCPGNDVVSDVLTFDVSSFDFTLYRYGGTAMTTSVDYQNDLPKTVYQFFYDMGEIEFPNESFQDKYRRTIVVSKIQIWLEACYSYYIFFNKSEVEKFLY